MAVNCCQARIELARPLPRRGRGPYLYRQRPNGRNWSMNISAAPSSSGIGPLRRLSVLDQAPIPEGATGGEALHNSIDLARLADSLGYHRYWLAEAHATPMPAFANPQAPIRTV